MANTSDSCKDSTNGAMCATQDINSRILTITQMVKDMQSVQIDLVSKLAELRVCLLTHHLEKEDSPKPCYFDAGRRLVQTTELLEKVLVHLPNLSLLFAQRVSRQFRSVITKSTQLQRKLFLLPSTGSSLTSPVILNPIISLPSVLRRLPLYFDPEESRLAYIPRHGRFQVFGETIWISGDPSRDKHPIFIGLTDEFPGGFCSSRPCLTAGSWKDMSLSQPVCGIKWHVVIHKNYTAHLYECTTSGASSLNDLLDTIAATTLERSTMGLVQYERQRRSASRGREQR